MWVGGHFSYLLWNASIQAIYCYKGELKYFKSYRIIDVLLPFLRCKKCLIPVHTFANSSNEILRGGVKREGWEMIKFIRPKVWTSLLYYNTSSIEKKASITRSRFGLNIYGLHSSTIFFGHRLEGLLCSRGAFNREWDFLFFLFILHSTIISLIYLMDVVNLA